MMDADCEICKHENITEEEFCTSYIHKIGESIIIAFPHTVKFKCTDCEEPVLLFISSGVFNY